MNLRVIRGRSHKTYRQINLPTLSTHLRPQASKACSLLWTMSSKISCANKRKEKTKILFWLSRKWSWRSDKERETSIKSTPSACPSPTNYTFRTIYWRSCNQDQPVFQLSLICFKTTLRIKVACKYRIAAESNLLIALTWLWRRVPAIGLSRNRVTYYRPWAQGMRRQVLTNHKWWTRV
jgi:hypothetical protein